MLQSASFRAALGWRDSAPFRPQPKSAKECVVVGPRARTRRKHVELRNVPSSNHGLIGLERGDKPRHDIGHVTAPFLLAVAFQSGSAHIVLIGGLLVWQVAK